MISLKQIVLYIKGLKGAKYIKEKVFKAENKEEILSAIKDLT
ncbi:MAG: hypothetical protein ACOX2Y_01180 [Christensenellales bacterium]|jgi:hypothetical protein